MSYAKASDCIQAATGVRVPRRTIHHWVNELAPSLLEKALSRGENSISEAGVVMGDSTDVRGLQRREMRHVRVLTDDRGGLLALRVDDPWPRAKAAVLVSDEETGLVEAVTAGRRQLCLLHGLKRLGFILWRDGMSKGERDEVRRAVRRTLFGLVAAARHLGGDVLRARIMWTRGELVSVAEGLRVRGYGGAADYLERRVDVLVAFAELALEGVRVPYTTNRLERLMGEVADRCKNRRMHWSSKGLRCMLMFLLVRYADKAGYEAVKYAYIHNDVIQ